MPNFALRRSAARSKMAASTTRALTMNIEAALQHRTKVEEFRRKHRIGLLTLLFTDVVGSTKLKQELGDQQAVVLLQRHHGLVREILSQFKEAEEIETAGDSFFIVFAKPSDAVRFSLRLQNQLRALAPEVPRKLVDRIGIHIGEVVIEEHEGLGKQKDLYGLQIDICARVMSLAEGDQILMTRLVFDHARQVLKGQEIEGHVDLSWLNHGPYLLKGVDEPLEICDVGELGAAILKPPPDSEKVHRYVSPDAEPVLGWRPAIDQVVPGTEWALVEKLGEGGFGEVWLGAHRKLKEKRVFKFCFRADRVRSLQREVTLFRLLKERLGQHPNIAVLQDVYLEEAPYYLTMEYVAGRDLKTWFEKQGGSDRVSLATRLEIVAQIADALQSAHDAGVIHRDVKPGNILISQPSTPNDLPTAKLTDFGIGQVMSAEVLAGMTRLGFTQTMMFGGSSTHIGTQIYMAPEVIVGKPASIRSDIYSLGVVLYQLLVGDFARPLTTDWPDHLAYPLLRDDLKHCFAGNPPDRFPGAGQLAMQLRRLPERRAALERQQAELAARERAAYRRGMIRTAGLALLVVVAVGALAVFAFRQARRANESAARARTEAAKTTQVATFLKDMLRSVGPSVSRGRDTVLLREVLSNTVSRLDKEMADQPEVEADLLIVLGQTYRDLGDYRIAIQMARRALELRRKVLGDQHDAVGYALGQLASALTSQGDWAEAERLQRQSLAIRERSLGPEHPAISAVLNNLAVILRNNGKPGEAVQAYRKALVIMQKQHPRPAENLADIHNNLSLLLSDLGDFQDGEHEAREAITAYRGLFGERHPKVGVALHNQAKLLRELSRVDDAERAIRQAIDVYGRVFKDGHDYHAEALDELALILEKKGDVKGAEAAFRDGLAMARRVLGEDHPRVLVTMRHLALLLSQNAATLPEAQELIHRSTTASRTRFAKQPAALASCLKDLATFFVNAARLKEAEPVLLEAYQLLANETQSSRQLKNICRELELLYQKLGLPDEAKKWAAMRAEGETVK